MLWTATAVLGCLTLGMTSVDAQVGGGAPSAPHVTKVYNIADLLDAPSMLADDAEEAGKTVRTSVGGFGGGIGKAWIIDGPGRQCGQADRDQCQNQQTSDAHGNANRQRRWRRGGQGIGSVGC